MESSLSAEQLLVLRILTGMSPPVINVTNNAKVTPSPSQGTYGAVPSPQLTHGAAPSPSQGTHGTAPSPSQGNHGAAPSPSQGTNGAAPSPSQGNHGAAPSPSQGTNGAAPSPSQGTHGAAPSPSQGTHGAVSSTLQVSHSASTLHGQTILLKVINPAKKREYKVFQIDVLTSVDSEKELRKVIFDKVGKNVVPFDVNFEVGYYEGNTRMSFPRNDEFKEKLCQVAKEGRYLWCYGNKEEEEEETDDAPPVAKRKKAVNSVELKAETVDAIANELKKKHGDKYTKIQCKLWAEVFVNKKHTSLEEPPLGSI